MQTKRQWMVSHEWMVKPMQQMEWIQGEGILIWLAEVFSSLGTGLYLVSIIVGSWWGALIGWLIIMLLKLPLHLIYLGKPLRFWRALPPFTGAWRTSWIARGFFFTTVYSGVGLIQLILGYYIMTNYGTLDPTSNGLAILDFAVKVLAGILCVLTAVYCGFMMSFCKSVPFWNTGILPIVIMNAGIADGLALVIGIGLFTSGMDIHFLESITRILLIVNIGLISTYLLNSSYRSETAKLSAKRLLVGEVALSFWIGVVILGILVPLIISIAGYFTAEISHTALYVAIATHTIGAFALKYCILKVGIYKPLIPKAKIN
jgi:formate-dependent nitrite reductase membrane component NrfD